MVVLIALTALYGASIVLAVPPVWYNGTCGVSKYADAGEMDLPANRIVGGMQARPHEFPWQVSIRYKMSGIHSCGGEIINENWVMSAAHCMGREVEEVFLIAAGEHTRNNPDSSQQLKNISQIYVHPEYNPDNLDFDITLMKLSTPLIINDDVRPVCAPDADVDYTYWKAQVSGWGSLISGGYCCPLTLLYTTLNITTQELCNEANGGPITDNMICAGDNNDFFDRDSCQGDSGGPLTVKETDGTFRNVGIVSWGRGCASGFPGVYTRVTAFNDWVSNIIANN